TRLTHTLTATSLSTLTLAVTLALILFSLTITPSLTLLSRPPSRHFHSLSSSTPLSRGGSRLYYSHTHFRYHFLSSPLHSPSNTHYLSPPSPFFTHPHPPPLATKSAS